MKTKEEIIQDLENIEVKIKEELETAHQIAVSNPATEEAAQKIRVVLGELEKVKGVIDGIRNL